MDRANIDLNTSEELLQEPEFKPFDPDCHPESGAADHENRGARYAIENGALTSHKEIWMA